jgi:photosystem II stability/assembly factor-like uncharacterized protein
VRKLTLLTATFIVSLCISFYFLKDHSKLSSVLITEHSERDEYEEDAETDEPGKFLEFHRGIRTRDGEEGPAYKPGYKWMELDKIRHNQFARTRAERARSLTNLVEWKERGPGNVPGRTRSLYNVPGDPDNNTWLAGSATGGIWRTTDGGTTWTERSGDFPALPISSFAGDASGNVIYAGTGEFLSSIYSAIGNGIFKSTDKGLTWTQLPATAIQNTDEFSIITRLVVNPANPDVIVATTVPHSLDLTDLTSAIMRSTNGGTSWTKVHEVGGILEQIIATPGDFDVQYASQNGVGVLKSVDGGLTWNLSNTGMDPTGRIEISVSPADRSVLYASAEGNKSSTESDLYRSADAGATWSLVDVKFGGSVIDFFEGQGFYDNTILADPFNKNIVYFGGVSLFRSTVSSATTEVKDYTFDLDGTVSFLKLLQFSGIQYAGQRLTVGTPTPAINVELRFGPGKTQKAHRFLVPAGKTSGVPAADYTYQNYVDVPFEVWDVTNNRQLMVSFRDQNRNGKFDLLPEYFSSTPETDYLNDSREYFYIQDINYSTTAGAAVMVNGGQEVELIYEIFPALAESTTWDPANLPESTFSILYTPLAKHNATTVTVADGRNSFDGKNQSNQVQLAAGVHPDHHFMIPLIDNATTKTYRLLIGNDGGVFVSKVSATPGITEGDWTFKGLGYNTSQFYGADKKPGADEYIGGMQDNGTRISKTGESASAVTAYGYAIGGDGFEVLWHSQDPKKILGSIYYGDIWRSTNGGTSFAESTSGLPVGDQNFSFVTKLANSKVYPDRVFTVGTQGVFVSNNFGGSWSLTEIQENWIVNTPFYLDVEISRANANIVWAGGGMSETAGLKRNLHVSTDGGKTFSMTNNYTTTALGNITKLASHPTEENTAYAIFSFAQGPKILRTTNLGDSWEDISGYGTNSSSANGFPDVAVYCIYVRPDNTNTIWAGTEIGIVESTDNGATWAILEDFPKVAVWDMKGQDDQVVIATHGRGIWTATIDEAQTINRAPVLVSYGTSPQNNFVFRIDSDYEFDSLKIYLNGALNKVLKDIPMGITDITLSGVSAGDRALSYIAYGGAGPFQAFHQVTQLGLSDPADSYHTFCTSAADVVTNMVPREVSGTTTKLLSSTHPYQNNQNYSITIKTPVTVSSSNPTFFLSDIAIVEPGSDSVVVEATKNGLDWYPLAPAHDATHNPLWTAAYNTNQDGDNDMFDEHQIDITDAFAAGDLLLFRVRMISNETQNAWGWTVNYIGIQQEPLHAEKDPFEAQFRMYPNPSAGIVNISYELQRPSYVSIKLMDLSGRLIYNADPGIRRAGKNTEVLQLQMYSAGTYLITVKAGEHLKTQKIILKR